jgi:hypothetical protein
LSRAAVPPELLGPVAQLADNPAIIAIANDLAATLLKNPFLIS